MAMNTFFASGERASERQLEHDAQVLAEAGIVDHITHVLPSILMVLNQQRQIVYANQRLLDFLDVSSDHDVLGLRPREILDCIHAHNNCDGCGTTEFCRECGAVKAILKSQDQKIGVEAECRITTQSGDPLDLRVWASPYTFEHSDFTIFSIVDIKDQKRRQILEQSFFHDMSNVLSSISGHSALLEMSRNKNDEEEAIRAIRLASKELNAEIWCHWKLMQAENNELNVDLSVGIHSIRMAKELIRLFSERPIVLASDSEEFELTTDRVLLFRVILNMVKNAHEAAGPTDPITLRCKREGDTGIFSVHNPNFMPRSTQLQIFQRSFTTKGSGHGIGTYSMRMFGEKYLKGKVGFTTSEQLGTTFYIALPLEYPK
ncbi:ATP-binding protein [Pontiellaceae bacterium B1224]|nr:ATP-binding protein [Pontiellaceae bacterium B1224]